MQPQCSLCLGIGAALPQKSHLGSSRKYFGRVSSCDFVGSSLFFRTKGTIHEVTRTEHETRFHPRFTQINADQKRKSLFFLIRVYSAKSCGLIPASWLLSCSCLLLLLLVFPAPVFWLGGRDSNPDSQIQSLESYHWTTSQQMEFEFTYQYSACQS